MNISGSNDEHLMSAKNQCVIIWNHLSLWYFRPVFFFEEQKIVCREIYFLNISLHKKIAKYNFFSMSQVQQRPYIVLINTFKLAVINHCKVLIVQVSSPGAYLIL